MQNLDNLSALYTVFGEVGHETIEYFFIVSVHSLFKSQISVNICFIRCIAQILNNIRDLWHIGVDKIKIQNIQVSLINVHYQTIDS